MHVAARGLTKRWFGPATEPAAGRDATLVDRLLVARGMSGMDAQQAFVKGSLGDLEGPWDRPDLVAAAEVILAAIEDGRRIAIYGDYDVDGITATAILWHTLRLLAPQAPIRTYVPHRMEEGYGLNAEALETLRREGIDLVVTVDCGITAVDEAAHARTLGLDLVVTDHHTLREDGRLPEARAVVHPALPGREHRCRDVCGALVAWKLAWAILDRKAGSPLAHRLPEAYRTLLTQLLPLAAIGTVADVMPLLGENRAIVKAGVAGAGATSIVGLRTLLRLGDVGRDGLDSEKVAFRLAPRLNACGRLGSAQAAVRLLTEADEAEATAIAKELDGLNEERRRTEHAIFVAASRMVRERGLDGMDRRAIVLAHPEWHAGVVGIVCSRLVEAFARPTLLCQELAEHCKGSGRSIRNFHLLDAIRGCGELPERSGGHEHAAGFSIAKHRFDAFAEAFTAHASRLLAPEDLVASILVDTWATVEELGVDIVRRCEQLAPFGRGNPRPTVRIDDVVVTAAPRTMGREQQHLLIQLRQGERGFVKAKWWQGRPHAEHLRPGTRLDVVVEPKIDRYLGDETVEVEIKDVRVRA